MQDSHAYDPGSGSLTGATLNPAPNDPPGEWRSQARDYANTRYSTLDQINTSNVSTASLIHLTTLSVLFVVWMRTAERQTITASATRLNAMLRDPAR